jgi:hypothetical protein
MVEHGGVAKPRAMSSFNKSERRLPAFSMRRIFLSNSEMTKGYSKKNSPSHPPIECDLWSHGPKIETPAMAESVRIRSQTLLSVQL